MPTTAALLELIEAWERHAASAERSYVTERHALSSGVLVGSSTTFKYCADALSELIDAEQEDMFGPNPYEDDGVSAAAELA